MTSDRPPAVGRLIAGEEEARRRIARELHDDHCQRLAALGFELEAVRRQLAEDDPRRVAPDAGPGPDSARQQLLQGETGLGG